jgi:hypothetical protein
MTLLLALALAIAAPEPSLDQWLAARLAEGRKIEYLENQDDDLVRVFLDRTGGCPRGWLRVTLVPDQRTVSRVDTFLGATCDAPPEGMNHLARLLEAVRLKDPMALTTFVPPGAQSSVATVKGREVKRRTFDHDTAKSGVLPLPRCDLRLDTPRCEAPRPQGAMTLMKCHCEGPSHAIRYDLRALRPKVDPFAVQLEQVQESISSP